MDWNPRFCDKSPLFWPLRRAAAPFASFADWPLPADLARAFVGEAPVRFEAAPPRARRQRPAAGERYDARITQERVVPTRAGVWHDFANALVWGTFPRAKAALHARQHRLISAQLGPPGDGERLPMRTPEQDAVAMLDEGGVVVLALAAAEVEVATSLSVGDGDARVRSIEEGVASAVVFGHAIYEALATRGPPVLRGAAYLAAVPALVGGEAALAQVDAALAALLTRAAPLSRADFASLIVDERWR